MSGHKNAMDLKQFEEHMWRLSTTGFTMVSVMFGNELGLFDIMENANRPLTSSEIAELAGLKERYVREWLGGMAASQVVIIDDLNSTYSIPEGHFHAIKENALFARGIKTCIDRFNITKQLFKTSEPWGCDFNKDDWMDFFYKLRDNHCETVVTRDILPNLEYSVYLKDGLKSGIQVLDIGCGAGPFTFAFTKRFPKSNFTGLDISDKALKIAKKRSDMEDVSNIQFIMGDAHKLPHEMTEQYDLVLMFDTLHNLSDPNAALGEVKRVLKPNGKIMLYEIGIHSKHFDNVGEMTASFWYTMSTFFCLPSSLSGTSRIGYGLGWGEEEMLKVIGSNFKFEKKFDFIKLQGLYIYSN